jgi:hypothetical protein
MKVRAISRLTALCALLVVFTATGFAQTTQTVYVTKTGSKYHRSGCSSLRRSSLPMSLDSAAVKYQPCKICKPPLLKDAAPATSTSAVHAETPSTRSAVNAIESGRCQAITKKGTQVFAPGEGG